MEFTWGDGLLGLGHDDLMEGYSPLLKTMRKQGVISKNGFSIFLDGNYKLLTVSGELTIGGYSDKYDEDEFTFAPVVSSERWNVILDSFTIGKRTLYTRNRGKK